jgi:signal transduction histidine kinase
LLPTKIEAQEAERTRIAWELHDDICQRLVVLGMQLDRIMQDLPVSAADLTQAVEEAHDQTSSLANDIQAGARHKRRVSRQRSDNRRVRASCGGVESASQAARRS